MAFWNERLKVGVKNIDDQHKELCDIIDKLLEACRSGKGRDEILKTITFLRQYTVKHFNEEEAEQRASKYPKIVEHRALHQAFIKQIDDISLDIKQNGANIATVSKVNTMLVQWLTQHITVVDKELVQYLK